MRGADPAVRRWPWSGASAARRSAVVIVAVVLSGGLGPASGGLGPASAAVPRPSSHALFRLSDQRLAEVSGVAPGLRSAGVLYVHNDSGDSARFFALDAATGSVRAVYDVPGATNMDWEDIAVARDARGVASIWLADIGDNDASRSEVRVYRVDEPDVSAAGPSQRRTTPPDVWRLRYPGGPRDAEGLAVATGGAAYIVDKTVFGATSVYAMPPRASRSRVQLLRDIGSFDTLDTRTAGGPNPFGVFTVTGAALSPGGVFVARTYTDAYLWRTHDDDLAVALRNKPVVIALPAQPQGEGVTVDGNRLITTSEHRRSTVFRVDLPSGAIAAPAARPSAPTAPPSVLPDPSATGGAGSGRPDAAMRVRAAASGDSAGAWVAAIAALLATAGLLVVIARRARRQ